MDLDVNFSLFCDVKIFTNSTYNIFCYVFSEAVVCRYFHNRCSQRFRNIHKKALVLDSPFSKVAGLKAYRIIKKRRQRLCNFILASNLFYASCLSCCLPKIWCLEWHDNAIINKSLLSLVKPIYPKHFSLKYSGKHCQHCFGIEIIYLESYKIITFKLLEFITVTTLFYKHYLQYFQKRFKFNIDSHSSFRLSLRRNIDFKETIKI